MKELTKLFEEQMDTACIHIDNKKTEIKGCAPALLTLYCNLSRILLDCDDIDVSDLNKAIKLATMSDEEIHKSSLKRIKEILSKLVDEELEEDDKNE